jgi:hypothetical protein
LTKRDLKMRPTDVLRRLHMTGAAALAAVALGACSPPPPEIVYIVLSPTPDPAATAEATPAAETATADVTPAAEPEQTETLTLPATVDATATPAADTPAALPTTAAPATAQPDLAAAAGPTPLPPGFPTPVAAEIQVAEQLFQGGRMFWLQPTGQIWVLVVTGEGQGTWTVYPDTFSEEAPTDTPTITPEAGLLVPERGFGRLWREVPEVREQLGFAVTPEFGYVSEYRYFAGGTVDAGGAYVPGPGYHILFSLYDEQFRFDERDGTWRLGS